MYNRPKVLALIAGVAVTSFTLAGCTSGTVSPGSSGAAPTGAASNGKAITIASNWPDMADPFWQTLQCGARKAAHDLNVNVTYSQTTTTNQSDIDQTVNSAILTKPDAMYLNAFQSSQFISQTKTLMSQGVPVVSLTPQSPAVALSNVAANNYGGQFDSIIPPLLSSGKGTVGVLGGTAGLSSNVDRWQPIVDNIKKVRTDITILPVQYNSAYSVTTATSEAAAMILAHPDLKMIIASSGSEALGAAAAIQQANKVGKVKLWGFEGQPAEFKLVQEGVITGLGVQPVQEMGYQSIKLLDDYLKANPGGKAVTPLAPADWSYYDLSYVNKDNVNTAEIKAFGFTQANCDVTQPVPTTAKATVTK